MTKLEKPCVFIVDDDPAMRRLSRAALSRAGFQVLEAENGRAALDTLVSGEADIVLLDVDMPVLNGFETCLEIRRLPRGKHLPIIMMTGKDDMASVNRAYDVGATDFVTKPINWTILAHRIRYLLRASYAMLELDRAMRELDRSRANLDRAQEIAGVGSWEFDPETSQMIWSDNMFRIFGLSPSGTAPTVDVLLAHMCEQERDLIRRWFSQDLKSTTPVSTIHQISREDGNQRSIRLYMEVTYCDIKRRPVLRGTIQDITEQLATENRIRKLALEDTLTGLPNREHFEQQLGTLLRDSKQEGHCFALLFIDTDDFKRVNDTLGHHAGDEVLRIIASRLSGGLRVADEVFHDRRGASGQRVYQLARLGGDEFTVLLRNVEDREDVAAVAKRLVRDLAQPIRLDDGDIAITCSIGIARYPHDGTEVDSLLRAADRAMYYAKRRGKDRYAFFSRHLAAFSTRAASL